MKTLTLLALTLLTSTLFGQATTKIENLKITWPEEYNWKIASNQEDKTTHFVELIPGKEKIKKWTMLGTMMSLKNTRITKTSQIVEMYKVSSKKQSDNANLTVLESSENGRNIWVLFKVETSSFPDDPKPESQLYYALQGEETLYINFIAVKQKTLSDDFVKTWTSVFKSSELVYQ